MLKVLTLPFLPSPSSGLAASVKQVQATFASVEALDRDKERTESSWTSSIRVSSPNGVQFALAHSGSMAFSAVLPIRQRPPLIALA